MRRLSHWCVPSTLLLGLALGACVNQQAGEQRMAEARAAGDQRRAAARAEATQRREAIRATALPPTTGSRLMRTLSAPSKTPIPARLRIRATPTAVSSVGPSMPAIPMAAIRANSPSLPISARRGR